MVIHKPAWLTRRLFVQMAIVAFPFVVITGMWYYQEYQSTIGAFRRGVHEAQADLANDHYEIKVYGEPPPPGVPESDRLVKDRYGVEINAVAGCLVTQDLVSYVEGYNSVANPQIQARFGKDIFAECAKDAKAAWDLAHPQK